jgi:serine protease Do
LRNIGFMKAPGNHSKGEECHFEPEPSARAQDRLREGEESFDYAQDRSRHGGYSTRDSSACDLRMIDHQNHCGVPRLFRLFLTFLLPLSFSSHLLVSLAFAQDTSRRSPIVMASEKASPAVVSIIAAQVVERRTNPFGGNPFFDDFFRDFFEPFQQRQTDQSLGSGVVISPDGYVLTNEHVVVQAEKIQVQLADDRKLNARLVGADSDSDLAVLKVEDSKSLPSLSFGNSDDLMIGETVIAIGNPFGLSHTVTTGVVSALNRSLNTDGRTYYDFIQTDASINPGNSGGPLLNIKGDLIGINTAIYGKAQGIGFAIPITRAKRIVQELISHGAVEPPWIGLVVQTLTPELAYHFSLKEKQGALVRMVESGSPAAKAGLQRGDVLVSLNGRPLRSAEEYLQREREHSSGDTLRLRVMHGGEAKEVAVTAARFPQEKADDLAWQLLRFALAESENGLEVKKVRPGSPAARIGVERGDAILGLSGSQTKTLAEFRRKIIDARLSQSLLLSIGRGRQLYHVTIPLDQG